jgi:hypothetical protein
VGAPGFLRRTRRSRAGASAVVDEDLLYVREIEGECPCCHHYTGEWATGVSVQEAIARIADDRLDLEDLFTWTCPQCGHTTDRAAAIVPDHDAGTDTLPLDERARMVETLRRLLRERPDPHAIAAALRRGYGVEAFYVRS